MVLVEYLSDEKSNIARNLARSGSFIERINDDIKNHAENFDEYAEREVFCLIDYVIMYFNNNDEKYRYLYIGERLKMAYDPQSSVQQRTDRLLEFIKRDKGVFTKELPTKERDILSSLSTFFEEIIEQFNAPMEKELRVLFIGDCLHQDVIGTLSVLMLQTGSAIRPYKIGTKNINQLRKEIAKLNNEQFDVIFYSPFSYNYNIELNELLNYQNIFINKKKFDNSVHCVVNDVEKIANRLTTTFDCPIYIHNTACIIRETSKVKSILKLLLTCSTRKSAMKIIDTRLKSYIESSNKTYSKQCHLFDELKYFDQFSSFALGQYLYRSPLQHPTKLGMILAEEYNHILYVLSYLVDKKMIVCDLDNTLWDGVIGEGPVTHFKERQEILLKLKSRGIMLAINSKNDPKNINWNGGVLSEKDFVYQSINWEPKIKAFREMQARLNIKMKHFAFVDDRPDELELIRDTYPEIRCMDATCIDTWHLFSIWCDLLDENDTMDRTQMYIDRDSRANFLQTIEGETNDETASFKKLELKLSVQEIDVSDVKRATELINRTNQFNMRASRTTLKEVENWVTDENFTVLKAEMSDKFGSMGIISILVYEQTPQHIFINSFVLSCRVFGYQVECAILNEVKKRALMRNVGKIVGEYIETDSNSPCKDVFKENQFTENGRCWEYFERNLSTLKDPEWLSINSDR